ncbi:hypothetical protein GCM10011354_12920 [Egicoccus halophilus]|uniref:histidine kinase n=1 Tax=Egicoccus halophilus TaxID=1670830 RepID=A0A8J3EX77_9ACTN|nr:hypothetical protein GCM10011354_12920 [Egicoccus halophilus]
MGGPRTRADLNGSLGRPWRPAQRLTKAATHGGPADTSQSRRSEVGTPRSWASAAAIVAEGWRIDPARSRLTGGTGLDLSIVRHAVENLGGSIEVASCLGEGTAFTVRLPAEPSD